MSTKSVSIIIPNYNGKKLLEQNLPYTLEAINGSHILDFEIIVCDDASIDDSVAFLEKNYPNIILVTNKVNRGFSSNCNSGINIASKELVLLLNSDVRLSSNYFESQFKYFEMDDTFGVMSRILDENNQLIDAAKYPEINYYKIDGSKNFISADRASSFTLFLSGANALVDRKKLLYIGGFCTAFDPYYYEDLDMGLNAWECGFKSYFDPLATCYHPVSTTIKKENSDKVQRISLRNKIIVHYFHLTSFGFGIFFAKTSIKSIALFLGGKKSLFFAVKEFVNNFETIRFFKQKHLERKSNVKNTRKLVDLKKLILQNIDRKTINRF